MKQFTYLATIFVFCGTVLLIMYKRQGRILRRHEQILLFMTLLGIPLAAVDYFAIHWGAWDYSTTSTLNVRFATEIETYLFSAGVFASVAAATLIWAAKTDKSANRNRHKAKKRPAKPKHVYARASKAFR